MTETATTTAVCEHCDWRYRLPSTGSLPICPHCLQTDLTPVDSDVTGMTGAVELVAPFSVSDADLSRGLQRFSSGFFFRPRDLTAENLHSRKQRLYLPRWLVDCDAEAGWRAEAGFDYQVVSHQDQFDESSKQWQSQQIREHRVRWEPRAGRLARHYENVDAPAMEEDAAVRQRLGDFDHTQAEAVDALSLDGALIRMPNRAASDAWNDAVPGLRLRAVEECRHACRADHLREFDWTPQFSGQHWTQLLLPVFTTYYADETGVLHAVLIHGQTGNAYGRRQAAFRPARNLSLVLGALAVLALFVSLLMVVLSSVGGSDPLRSLGLLGVLAAMVTGILAIVPIAYVWIFNRLQPPDPPI